MGHKVSYYELITLVKSVLGLDTDKQYDLYQILKDWRFATTEIIPGLLQAFEELQNNVDAIDYTLEKVEPDSEEYASSYELHDKDGNPRGVRINIYKDKFISQARFDEESRDLILTFNRADGTTQDVNIPLDSLWYNIAAGSGITITDQGDGSKIVALSQDTLDRLDNLEAGVKKNSEDIQKGNQELTEKLEDLSDTVNTGFEDLNSTIDDELRPAIEQNTADIKTKADQSEVDKLNAVVGPNSVNTSEKPVVQDGAQRHYDGIIYTSGVAEWAIYGPFTLKAGQIITVKSESAIGVAVVSELKAMVWQRMLVAGNSTDIYYSYCAHEPVDVEVSCKKDGTILLVDSALGTVISSTVSKDEATKFATKEQLLDTVITSLSEEAVYDTQKVHVPFKKSTLVGDAYSEEDKRVTLNTATNLTAGVLSAADKKKLDDMASEYLCNGFLALTDGSTSDEIQQSIGSFFSLREAVEYGEVFVLEGEDETKLVSHSVEVDENTVEFYVLDGLDKVEKYTITNQDGELKFSKEVRTDAEFLEEIRKAAEVAKNIAKAAAAEALESAATANEAAEATKEVIERANTIIEETKSARDYAVDAAEIALSTASSAKEAADEALTAASTANSAAEDANAATDAAEQITEEMQELKKRVEQYLTDDTAANLAEKPELRVGTENPKNITVTAGRKTSDEFTVPFATEATELTNAPALSEGVNGRTIKVTAGEKTSAEFIVPFATLANDAITTRNLNVAPELSAGTANNTITVTVGNKTSDDFTVPFATNSSESDHAKTADTATNIDVAPTLAVGVEDNKAITVQVGDKVSNEFTVPFATESSESEHSKSSAKLDTANVGSDDVPVYFQDGVPLPVTGIADSLMTEYTKSQDLPDKLPNPHSLTIMYNKLQMVEYDGSAPKTAEFNVYGGSIPLSEDDLRTIKEVLESKSDGTHTHEDILELIEKITNGQTTVKEAEHALTADTATNLSSDPSIQAGVEDPNKITVTAGNRTSEEFEVPYATKSGSAADIDVNPVLADGTAEKTVTVTVGTKKSTDYTVPFATEATELTDAPSITNGSDLKSVKVVVGTKDSSDFTVPYATESTYLTNKPELSGSKEITVKAGEKVSDPFTVPFATSSDEANHASESDHATSADSATNIDVAASLQKGTVNPKDITVKVGDKTSEEFTVPFATESSKSAHASESDHSKTADTATNISVKPSLSAGADGKAIKVTVGDKSSTDFTVPFATESTNLTNNPSIQEGTVDNKSITITAGEKTSEEFKVKYSEEAGNALKFDGHDTSYFVLASEKGVPNGIPQLDDQGRIPASQIPGVVQEVQYYESLDQFPSPSGTPNTLYIAKDTNLVYLWTGEEYKEVSPSIGLGTTTDTAYPGDKGQELKELLDSLLDGTTKVKNAEHADNADHASHSDTATSSSTAGSAAVAATADTITHPPVLAAGSDNVKSITVQVGDKTSEEFVVPFATEATNLTNKPVFMDGTKSGKETAIKITVGNKTSDDYTVPYAKQATSATNIDVKASLQDGVSNPKNITVTIGDKVSDEYEVPYAKEALNLTNTPELAGDRTITVKAGEKTSSEFTVPFSTEATQLTDKPSLQAGDDPKKITVTAGTKTSDEFTVPYATEATNLTNVPTFEVDPDGKRIIVKVGEKESEAFTVPFAEQATSATNIDVAASLQAGAENPKDITVKVGDKTSEEFTVPFATEATQLTDKPSLQGSKTITVTAGTKTSVEFTVPFATEATNLSANPSLAGEHEITVTAGGKTSDEFTVPYATESTNLTNNPALAAGTDPKKITVKAGEKTSAEFTVPFATESTNLTNPPTFSVDPDGKRIVVHVGGKESSAFTVPFATNSSESDHAKTADTATNIDVAASLQAGTENPKDITVKVGDKTSAEFTVPFATEATNLTNAPVLAAGTAANTIKVTAGGKTSADYTVPYATKAGTATSLAAAPALAKGSTEPKSTTVTAGGVKSAEYIIHYATEATNLTNAPVLAAGTAANTIKVTAGGKTSADFTVPYATKAGSATSTPNANHAASADSATSADSAKKTVGTLTLKVGTGTTEGTDVYTFNGSVNKSLTVKAGTNVTIAAAAGTATVSSKDTTYTFAGGTGQFTVTPSGGSAQVVSIGKPSTAGTADTANKVANSLVIKLNSGATEGTSMFTYNGSAIKTVNITPALIGAAAASHTHDNYATKSTTLSGYGITDGVNSVATSGSGNAVTGGSIAGHALTLTLGKTFSESTHTHNSVNRVGTVTTALKFWSGTKAQYTAITSKDANTLYMIIEG